MEKDDIEHDVDDIFKDFQIKVEDKEDKEHSAKEKGLSEEEHLKAKYQKAEQALKEQHRRERESLLEKKRKKEEESLAEKRKKEMVHHETVPRKNSPNIEKVAYAAIIFVLAAYIVIDLYSYHDLMGDTAETNQAITAAAVKEDDNTTKAEETAKATEEETIEEVPVENVLNESAVEEEKKLSGEIAFDVDNIYTDVIDEEDDLGYITKIVFTIDNGKDKVLTPIVNVYVYDSEMHESWETRSRGEYTYNGGISPGNSHTASIDLSPKSFRNLDIKKSVRLVLNSTEEGFIAAVNEKVLIE